MAPLLAALLLIACTDPSTEQSTEQSNGQNHKQSSDKDPALLARVALDQAQAQYEASRQAGYAWARTPVLLKSATEDFAAGDFSGAASTADQATRLADASLAQAQAEQTAWLDRFPKTDSSQSPLTQLPLTTTPANKVP